MSKHHLLGQGDNWNIGYTIVSGKTPSSVALHKNDSVVFIEILAKY